MSAIEDFIDWYRLARIRRDANWAPSELRHAAEDELIAESALRGASLSRDDAYSVLLQEMRARQLAQDDRQAEIARDVITHRRAHPKRRDVEEWTREDIIREVQLDQAGEGRGGRRRLASRYNVSPSKLYRRWQAVAPGEPWPSGQKGPPNRS